jgi:hypothetical protein
MTTAIVRVRAAVRSDDPAPARWRRPGTWLAVVAVLHAASPLVLLGAHWWFGIDETVYLSQINAYVPAGGFSAPRARGTTFVAAPVTMLTTSVAAIRIWVAAVSGAGLYLAFRPWLRLYHGYVVPLAALLFATVWSVIFYGFAVMPNEFVALAAVGACGCLLRFTTEGRRRHLVGVGIATALIGLLRPSDAAYAGVALLVSCVVLRASWRRRVAAAAAVSVGALAGVADWVIEARTSYGGVATRIHAAQAENGGGGLHFAGAAQARALAGPVLCRGSCHVSAGIAYQLWWIVLSVLVVAGVAFARRQGRLAPTLVPTCVGLSMAAQYVFTVTYAAPRFLIPAYALLSLPAASGAVEIVRRARSGVPRTVLVSGLGAILVAHAAVQVHVLTGLIAPHARITGAEIVADAEQLHDVGVRGPCLVLGSPVDNQDLAYATGCSNVPRGATAVRDRVEDGSRVVWLNQAPPPRSYSARWHAVQLPGGTPSITQRVYISVGPSSPDTDGRR